MFGGPGTFVFFHPANFSSSLEQDAGVPEPASWMLMEGGFGPAGAGLGRARRTAIRFG